MDWFLYYRDFCHERVKGASFTQITNMIAIERRIEIGTFNIFQKNLRGWT